MSPDEIRKCETLSVGELLEEILAELRLMNKTNHELEERVKALENNDELLSLTEAASLIGKSRQTVARWLSMGKIRQHERGGDIGILKSDLLRVTRV